MTITEYLKQPAKARFEMLSGLGGTFTVRVLQIFNLVGEDATAVVRIQSPSNPDWHGYEFNAALRDIFPFGTPQIAMYRDYESIDGLVGI